MPKYMIGCGRQRRKGWLSVDADPRVKPDIVSSLPPIPEECRGAEAFELIHVLEHFYQWEAIDLIGQMCDMLVDGGKMILELPNLQSAIDTLSGKNGKPTQQWGMWVLYGDPRHKNPLFGHKWAWTPDSLYEEVSKFSFSKIAIQRAKYHVPDRDFRLVATK